MEAFGQNYCDRIIVNDALMLRVRATLDSAYSSWLEFYQLYDESMSNTLLILFKILDIIAILSNSIRNIKLLLDRS
jgi:hypothetical protein